MDEFKELLKSGRVITRKTNPVLFKGMASEWFYAIPIGDTDAIREVKQFVKNKDDSYLGSSYMFYKRTIADRVGDK